MISIINYFVGRKNWIDTCELWRQNAAVLRVYKFYVAIYFTRIYLIQIIQNNVQWYSYTVYFSIWL